MILTAPKTHIIGSTEMQPVDGWAADYGLTPVLMDDDTPLGNLGGILDPENLIEFAGRHCYRSWNKGRGTEDYIRNLIEQGHESVLEHVSINFAIGGVSRTLTHELLRHRPGIAISQESQRYVNAKDINFVVPPLYLWLCQHDLNHPKIKFWESSVEATRAAYIELMNGSLATAGPASTIEHKRLAEAARSVLSNAAETRLTWTANIRILRHVFKMRGQQAADLEIRRLDAQLFDLVQPRYAIFFEDLKKVNGDFGVPMIVPK
jgi:thymidylate synthase (FAD)